MISLNPGSFSAAPASAAINHLLAQEPWARQELRRHAGKIACIDAGTVELRLRVTADGYLEAAPAGEAARVTIRVKLSDLPLIAQNRERAFSYVQIEGDAEFANAISHLSQSLRWEAEYDLERLLGPVAAVRLVQGAKAVVQGARNGQRKVAEAYIAQLNKSGAYPKALATTVEPQRAFYPAEDYHQDYLVRHPYSMYIMVNDVPKVENLAKTFPDRYRDKPVLVKP